MEWQLCKPPWRPHVSGTSSSATRRSRAPWGTSAPCCQKNHGSLRVYISQPTKRKSGWVPCVGYHVRFWGCKFISWWFESFLEVSPRYIWGRFPILTCAYVSNGLVKNRQLEIAGPYQRGMPACSFIRGWHPTQGIYVISFEISGSRNLHCFMSQGFCCNGGLVDI